jgi:hypothetical protein
MSQDQRPPQVRLTRTAGATAPARRRADPRSTVASSAAPVRRRLDFGVLLLFVIACLVGGVLTTLFDLPGLVLS